MKTILCHVQDDPGLDSRLEMAVALARSTSAHLACLYSRATDLMLAYDGFGLAAIPDVANLLEEQETNSRARVGKRLANEDVQWDFREAAGAPATELVRAAALADLLVVGRDSTIDQFGLSFLGSLLLRSRTPLFIAPEEVRSFDPLGPALIAWNGGYEAANAVRSSVALLKLASQVSVIAVGDEEQENEGRIFPNTHLLEYLSRYDIHAELEIEPAAGRKVADIIISEAKRIGAAYLVTGSYGHSRLNELIFGGVTRALLSSSPIPLLTTH